MQKTKVGVFSKHSVHDINYANYISRFKDVVLLVWATLHLFSVWIILQIFCFDSCLQVFTLTVRREDSGEFLRMLVSVSICDPPWRHWQLIGQWCWWRHLERHRRWRHTWNSDVMWTSWRLYNHKRDIRAQRLLTLHSAKAITVPHRIMWSYYTDHWWVDCYVWYSEEGTGQGHSPPRSSSLY